MNQNDFPRMVYKAGGTEEIHGGRFQTRIVDDADELEAALAGGWSLTTPEAKKAADAVTSKTHADGTKVTGTGPLPPLSPEEQAKLDSAPPTRDELKQKAAELKLDYPGNISNAKLAEMVEAALAGGAKA